MEEQLIPPLKSDPEFTSELTRTIISNSASSASVALGTPVHAAPGIPIEWTNEKHRSYINSLETSFVNKLYQSRRLWDCHPQMYVQGAHPSQELPFRTYNSSDQFMVVRDRRSQKIISLRNETPLESTADSNVTVERPRMDNIVSCYKEIHLRRKPTSEHLGVTARSSEKNPAFRQDLVGSTAEVSGQNFVEEDHRGKPSCEFIPKRLRRAADTSSNDQLVPLGYDTKEVSMAHNAPSKGEEQEHHQLLLEHHESFICPKSIFTVS
uniref:uncharacterized protein LOC101292781 isoform X2 n=1 Tax=Fragaria vesca subsp. vesca TaxID=101020 RepID=UPI0005C8D55F|nr:PREDICTED: uncharacterized protein LOC101292781 isoform X2 [Fragaria vesca subsp. vesca]